MPVWGMSYGGSYPKEVIPLLKDALGAAYVCHFFNGGRGPKAHTRIGMRYENVVEPGGNFVQFKGREEIRFDHDQAGEVLGFHEYFGGSLI
ncbi:TPA: hypothetical protein DEB29_01520 [Candidatus Wolfebacteria bacterium]|nr:hypothetical protein [Candidatus Wolfebacteria bacterium]